MVTDHSRNVGIEEMRSDDKDKGMRKGKVENIIFEGVGRGPEPVSPGKDEVGFIYIFPLRRKNIDVLSGCIGQIRNIYINQPVSVHPDVVEMGALVGHGFHHLPDHVFGNFSSVQGDVFQTLSFDGRSDFVSLPS